MTSADDEVSSEEGRVNIRVTWRSVPGVDDGATAPFTVSPTLSVEQVALLPPPLAVRHAQIELSSNQVGVVLGEANLMGTLTITELVKRGNDPASLHFEVYSVELLRQRFGALASPATPRTPDKPTRSRDTMSTVKSRHMTSVQLVEHLRSNNVELPEGLSTPRATLRKLAADLEGGVEN